MKKLFRFPIFDRARRAGGTHSAMEGCGGCSRFTILALLITLHASLITGVFAPSCGGDDKKDGGSSSGGSAKARVEATLEEWMKKSCEVSYACGGTYGAQYGSVEACQEQIFETEEKFGRESGGFLAARDSCYAIFSDNYEACKNVVSPRPAASLCQSYGGSFYGNRAEPQSIFKLYPECGNALSDLGRAKTECGLSPTAFLSAPGRPVTSDQ